MISSIPSNTKALAATPLFIHYIASNRTAALLVLPVVDWSRGPNQTMKILKMRFRIIL